MHGGPAAPFPLGPTDFITMELPVRDGAVQRDPDSQRDEISPIVDRFFSGEDGPSAMFWLGTGPRTPETALACSYGAWTSTTSGCGTYVGRGRMAQSGQRADAETQGGWALVARGGAG